MTTTAPPRAHVQARVRLTEDSLLRRGRVEPASADARTIARLLEEEREDSRRHARRLADLAPFWIDHEDPDLDDDREERSLAVAIATPHHHRDRLLSDRGRAHRPSPRCPATFERLTAGDMPVEWHTRMLKAVRDLTAVQRAQVDEIVASWDLASVPADRFRDELRRSARLYREMSAPWPESLRDVSLENSLHDDGTACLRITGPIPEILDLARRLDRSAKTVQARQRRALEQGEPIPFDLDGDVAATERP